MSEIYYSTDGETFNDQSIDDAICQIIESDEALNVGDIITVYSGEAVKKKASDYISSTVEDMEQNAYDDMGEYANEWPDLTKDEADELTAIISAAVDEWADKYELQPKFYGIRNQKEIKVKILNIDYEIMTGEI